MAALEDLGSGNRTGPQQAQLNRYRDWMSKHVEPHVGDLIACEGFWAAERPRWSRSRAPSDGNLQVGRMCLFPVIEDAGRLVATTCTNGHDTTWNIAFARGYTLVPQPFTPPRPIPLRPPSRRASVLTAWRARHEHSGLLTALRKTRSEAIEATREQNAEREAAFEAAGGQWRAQRERAAQVFRERHSFLSGDRTLAVGDRAGVKAGPQGRPEGAAGP